MFGLILLPFKLFYWWLKAIAELIEMLNHRRHHRRHHAVRHASTKVRSQRTSRSTAISASYNATKAQTTASEELDVLFMDSADLVVDVGQASVSMLQRRFRIGYSRAARIVDQMEQSGIIGPFEGSKPRTVLITSDIWEQTKASFRAKSESSSNTHLSESEATTDA